MTFELPLRAPIREAIRKPVVRNIDGAPLNVADDLPNANDCRWTPRRKANLLLAIDGGVVGIELALTRYALSRDELAAWRRDIGRHGYNALKTTKLKKYRGTS